MIDPRTENLPTDLKKWLGMAILATVLADGRISTDEKAALNDVRLLISQNEQDESIRIIRAGKFKMPNLQVERRMAGRILIYLAGVTAQDRSLAEREIDLLRHFAERLGLPPRIGQMAVELAEALIAAETRKQTILDAATGSVANYRP